jgi:LuxR family maltose regulon positive regulatory protein
VEDFLLPTKLLIPQTRPELVARYRLIKRLNNGLHHTLTLVSAPAGFGKTTLVARWVEELRQNQNAVPNIYVAWLSISEPDNDINRFLTYFFNAITHLENITSNQAKEIQSPLQSLNLPPIETLFSPLLKILSTITGKIIFVLDDYHLIDNLTIHKVLNFWLETVPQQVHTVVITREDPPFPLARFRARSQITELREKNLRFNKLEVIQFLNEIMRLRLDEEAIALLDERTEGWIAGLQMAALSMRDRKDIDTFVKNFSGTNRYILDYLLEEVLANQSKDIQQFLLETSILKRLSGSLCDVLTGKTNQSTTILEHIEQANLFLIPLDDERKWYRYHHLFADLLISRLKQTHTSTELANLHSRAAEWFEKNGMAYAAIYHASLIPDDVWVERIIDNNYMDIFQRRDSAAIRHWTGELGTNMLVKRPQLAIHEANSRAWFGQLDEADYLLDVAESKIKAQKLTPEVLAMYGYIDYVRSRITAMRGNFEHAIKLCLRAKERTPENNPGLLGGIGVMLGYGYFLNGDFSQAIQILEETIQNGKIFGAVNTTVGAYCVLARLHTIQGKLQKAYRLYQEAKNFIQLSEGDLQGAMSIVDVGFAEILYEWNDLDNALSHTQLALELIPRWSKADDIALAHVFHSLIQLAQGNQDIAESAIQKGVHIIHSSGVFPEAREIVRSTKIRLQLKQNHKKLLFKEVKTLEERLRKETPFQFEDELILIALARIYLAQKKFKECIKLLTQLEANARSSERNGRLIQILALEALTFYQLEEYSKANRYLSESLELAAPEDYVRSFLDEGQPFYKLLTDWLNRTDNEPLRSYAEHLVSQFSSEKNSYLDLQRKPGLEEKLIEPLSSREIEVLSLIALGKTNKEIAEQLIVSPGTIKAHTSSIYRKLEVNNRTEAVTRARNLEIIT